MPPPVNKTLAKEDESVQMSFEHLQCYIESLGLNMRIEFTDAVTGESVAKW